MFMQTPYPAATPIQYNRLQSQASEMNQPSHRHSDSQHSIHLPPINSSDVYAASNPPLESPSLNISGGPHEEAMRAVTQDQVRHVMCMGMRFFNTLQDFPPYDLLYALTDLFFKHINTWCPILHRRSTLDSLFGSTTLEEADRILLHAIVATTLRFSTDSRLSDPARERYHATSKQKVLLYGLENSSVKALQALVILALDIMGNSNGPPGWNLLALITRSVVQLGLAVETTSASIAPLYPSIYTLRAMVLPESKSFIEDESRRRLFWMVYLLDRYATIATAFEFALDDKEIDRKLPCRDDLFARNQPIDTRWFQTEDGEQHNLNDMNHPENLGSFSYYIEILGILSQIHRFLKKPVDISALSDVEQWQQQYRQLDSKLNNWKFSLPSEYGNMSRLFNPNGGNKIVNCIWIMLHMTYHTYVCLGYLAIHRLIKLQHRNPPPLISCIPHDPFTNIYTILLRLPALPHRSRRHLRTMHLRPQQQHASSPRTSIRILSLGSCTPTPCPRQHNRPSCPYIPNTSSRNTSNDGRPLGRSRALRNSSPACD